MQVSDDVLELDDAKINMTELRANLNGDLGPAGTTAILQAAKKIGEQATPPFKLIFNAANLAEYKQASQA